MTRVQDVQKISHNEHFTQPLVLINRDGSTLNHSGMLRGYGGKAKEFGCLE